jgi:hypothetical protein
MLRRVSFPMANDERKFSAERVREILQGAGTSETAGTPSVGQRDSSSAAVKKILANALESKDREADFKAKPSFQTSAAKVSVESGFSDVRQLGGEILTWYKKDVLQATWAGTTGATDIEKALNEAKIILGERGNSPFFVVDCTNVQNYSTSIAAPSKDLVRFLRERGLQEIIGIFPMTAVRMFATTTCFLLRQKLSAFASWKEAAPYVDQLVAK